MISRDPTGDSEDETPEADLDYDNADYGDNPTYGASKGGVGPATEFREPAHPQGEATGSSWGARMSGALRRTPSPQQLFESAGKTVSAGIAATGAAITNTLAAIREEDKNAFADHETWSEEADAKLTRPRSQTREPSKRRRTVAIVVSADSHVGDLEEDGFHEHASILSHIPKNIDFNKVKLFVLIYAPGLKDHPLDQNADVKPPSLSSSFSNIGPGDAQTPAEEKSPLMMAKDSNPVFNTVYSQALSLVEKETMVLPFTSSNGHVHILRHLQPEVIYLQESLAGDNGTVINHIQTWLKYDVILVVGAESGHGGLADSESEEEKAGGKMQKWWQREDRVGRGRGIVVVDSMRVHDDWTRRVEGKE